MNYLKKGLHAFTLRRLCMESYSGAEWRSVKTIWTRTPAIGREHMALPLGLELGSATGGGVEMVFTVTDSQFL